MTAEDLLGLAIPLTWFALLAAEARWPARAFPRIPFWRATGIAAMLVAMTINALLPLAIDPTWLAAHRVLDGDRLGVAGGTVVGFLAVTFATSLWHRLMHRVPALFRIHQLHHAPHRVDLAGALYLHPLEIAAQVVITLAITVPLLGLDPLAAAVTGYVGAVYAMVQHLNVRTPRWLGYLVQRPESHGLHHERGVHARNYSDLPLWDLLFGTFANPERFEGEVGFDGNAPQRLGAMLLLRDVSGVADVSAAGAAGRPAVRAAVAQGVRA